MFVKETVPRSFRRLPIILVVFFVITNRALCLAQDSGDAFVSGATADARTLLPILASDSASGAVCGMIYNGLVKYDKDLNLVGDLAEGWEIEDGGLAIVFHLRRGVTWHDGAPFTARDVEFTYRALIDPGIRTPYSGDFERVRSLEVVDDYTVRVTYKEPFAPALSSWGMPIMPRHILEGEDLNTSAFQRSPVGTGPYRFRAWKAQEKIELAAYPGYFEMRPRIERYIYRVIPEESTMFLELLTEGVDSSGLTPLQYVRQTDTEPFRSRYAKFRLPSFTYTYLGYNLKNPKFSDVRVRQALNYAVDKDEIIAIVLLGLGRVSNGPFVPESWACDPTVEPAAFDPGRARKLLAEAGWIDRDNDGWLDKDGEPFSFTIVTNQGSDDRVKCAQIIQRRLAEIGIKVKIKVLEWSVFLSECTAKKNFEAVLLGWSLPREPDNYDIWHSSKTREGEFNFVGYANEEVDRLLTEARRTFDETKRKECYHRINRLIYEDQPYMFLYVPDSLSALHRRFREVRPAPAGIGYNFIEWWVPRKEQRYRTRIELEP